MQIGTKVYWYHVDPKEHLLFRRGLGPKPEPVKLVGTVVTMPEASTSWMCLVTRDDTQRVVELNATRLFVVTRELPL